MPKLKLKFDRKAVAGFFVSHIEKIVLGLVLVVFVTFVYTGYSVEGISSDRTPESLDQLTTRVKQHINLDTWDVVKVDHTPPTGLAERAKKAEKSLSRAVAYAPSKPFVPETKASGMKRADPEMLSPIEVEATVVIGPVAGKVVGDTVDLLDLKEDTEMAASTQKRKKKRKKRGGKMTQKELDAAFGAEDTDQSSDPFAQVSGGGPDIFGAEEDGKTPASAADRTFPGYRPEGEATPISQVMVAVKALVPVQKQWDLFDQTLAGAMHYNQVRDSPKYLAYEAHRAEVSDDPNAELNWVLVSNTGLVERGLARISWTGLAGEIADGRYVNPKLTMPIPPIMMRKSTEFALHSKIPRILKTDAIIEDLFAEEDDDAPVTFGLGAASGVSAVAVSTPQSPAAAGQNAGAGAFGAFGMATSDPMARQSGSSASGPAAEYLLVRCFDFTAEVGKKYRYKFRVYVEDPNRPVDPRLWPQERALDAEVKKRLAANGDHPGYIASEWSQPSDIVRVEMPRTTLAGRVDASKATPIPNTAISIPLAEPKAKVLSIVYDYEHAADVPAFLDAYRGTYFEFTQDADVVHPVTLAFKKLESYTISTNRLLVDFRGGEVLPKIEIANDEDEEQRTKRKKKDEEEEEEVVKPDLYAASEYIFLDLDGNFFVRNDLDDEDTFSLYVVPEKDPEE